MSHAFEITVTSCKNYTWQGMLRIQGTKLPFKSEMELLMEMEHQMSRGESEQFFTEIDKTQYSKSEEI